MARAYDPVKARVRLLKRYGLTPPDYARLLLNQGGVCAICHRKPTNYPLHVDHDHTTREVRGLLCHRCNRGLGFFSAASVPRIRDYVVCEGGSYTGYFVPKKKRRR